MKRIATALITMALASTAATASPVKTVEGEEARKIITVLVNSGIQGKHMDDEVYRLKINEINCTEISGYHRDDELYGLRQSFCTVDSGVTLAPAASQLINETLAPIVGGDAAMGTSYLNLTGLSCFVDLNVFETDERFSCKLIQDYEH